MPPTLHTSSLSFPKLIKDRDQIYPYFYLRFILTFEFLVSLPDTTNCNVTEKCLRFHVRNCLGELHIVLLRDLKGETSRTGVLPENLRRSNYSTLMKHT
jgi:hypothetical protein